MRGKELVDIRGGAVAESSETRTKALVCPA